jgi:phenylacetate-CoA ligase
MPQLPDFKRDITRELSARLTEPGNPIQIIRGPRQVGKTTAIQQVLAELGMKNIYGTADIGPMAFETPVTILIRRMANENKELFREIFPHVDKTPTLAQYNPHFITFEAPDGNILVTGNSSIPFIRNSIGDHGGVMSFDALRAIMQKHGIDIAEECAKHNISLYQLPVVYIYERSDFSTNLYGIQIYPEYLRDTFVSEPTAKMLTGKFTLMTKYDEEQNQYLEINVELKKNSKQPTLRQKKQIFDSIEKDLRAKSSEYKELSNHMQERDLIAVEYWPAEDPLHFLPGGKQKWVKK